MATKKPKKMRNCYCVKIPQELYDALEKKRIENRHNKTAVVLIMAEAYLKVSDSV